jgi:hypothetical protein
MIGLVFYAVWESDVDRQKLWTNDLDLVMSSGFTTFLLVLLHEQLTVVILLERALIS